MPTESVAGVELYGLPTPVVEACQQFQRRTQQPILCPARLPRPSRALLHAAFIPGPVEVYPIRNRKGAISGVSLGYSAETGQLAADLPERFLHFDVQTRTSGDRLPASSRPETLAGKRGLLALATSRNYATEPYFANHVRFFWQEQRVRYAATLHNFGPATKDVLGALIKLLRPPAKLRSPRSGLGVDLIRVPVDGPVSVATDRDAVWVAGTGGLGGLKDPDAVAGPALIRIDPTTKEVAGDPLQISDFLGPVSVDVNHDLWIAQPGYEQPDLLRLEENSHQLTEYFTPGTGLDSLSVTRSTVWAADLGRWTGQRHYSGGKVVRLDPDTGRAMATIPVGGAPAGIAVGGGSVWVTNNLDDTVSRIDPRTNRVAATVRPGQAPAGVALGYGAVWVANAGSNTVSRIDPRSARVTRSITVGRGPRGVAAGAGSVWVTNYLDDTVSRIDPDTDRITETISVGAGPTGVAVGDGAIWVADMLDRTVSRIDP